MENVDDDVELKRKALYNSLRMLWMRDPSLDVEAWQVEDYRALEGHELFKRLAELGIQLDRREFLAYAEESEGPEFLADMLVGDEEGDTRLRDQIYLLVFELWRRYAHDQPCLTIFCDELDHQIGLYDRDEVDDLEALQDTLAALETVLDENADQGVEPEEIFATIVSDCAHDIESFIYDYVAEQVDEENFQYASELVDGFYDYVPDKRWFEFVKARMAMMDDPIEANSMLEELIEEADDIELCFEMLAFLVHDGQKRLFVALIERTIPLLEKEADLMDLLTMSLEFCQRLDDEQREEQVQILMDSVGKMSRKQPVAQLPEVAQLRKIFADIPD